MLLNLTLGYKVESYTSMFSNVVGVDVLNILGFIFSFYLLYLKFNFVKRLIYWDGAIYNIYNNYFKPYLKLINENKQIRPILLIAVISLTLSIFISLFFNLNLTKNDEVNQIIYFDHTKFWIILKNNLTVIIVLISGIILFKIPTVVSLIINYFMLGFYLVQLVKNFGFVILVTIVPHGVLEFLIFFIVACIGFANHNSISLKQLLKLLIIIIGGIVIAAFIEVSISANLAKLIIPYI